MATTLRELLIQRAARLQGRPALTAPEWGTLTYAQLRNRAEGVALGLLAEAAPEPVFSATGTPWDWAAELAAAAAGLTWDTAGGAVSPEVLGGGRFNAEAGRGPFHAREQVVVAATPFTAGLNQGDLMGRLRRLNVQLGWDHDTIVDLPLTHLGSAPVRAALWSALYAGAHATLRALPAWDPQPFRTLWQP
jgi:hypothetical protein